MTTTLMRLPIMAGGALMSGLGRVGLWGIGRFASAPVASTAIIAITTLSVMAASNALYFQKRHHPSPFFSPSVQVAGTPDPAPAEPVRVAEPASTVPAVAPVIAQPAQTQATETQTIVTGSTQSANEAGSDEPTGNAEVYAVQKKLAEMKLFSGKADGYYGPQTATAIRAFELSVGRNPQGALTPDIVKAILRAPVLNPAVAPAQERQPVRTQQAATAVPQQVTSASSAPSTGDSAVLIGRVADSGPELMLDTVGGSAAAALDNLVSTLQGDTTQQEASPTRREAALPAQQPPAKLPPATVSAPLKTGSLPTTDPVVVSKVQRGLASLGFLAGAVDGVPGESTARAIRNFEVYYNYKVSGEITPDLVDMLKAAGAVVE